MPNGPIPLHIRPERSASTRAASIVASRLTPHRTPDAAASLWAEIADPSEEWPKWAQPIGAHDAYSAGAKVSHSEKKWTSDLDNNVWEPGVYGWTEVKDLDAMTVAELKEYASENGIALTGLTLKADILAAIKTAEGVTA